MRDIVDVVNDEHMHARGALEWVNHPTFGRVVLPNSPLRFAGAAPLPLQPSGELGRDNMEVYSGWLGLNPTEVETLAREEVI